MSTLLLKLAGPLQSWGAESRFTERKTRPEPTKSAVLGLIAAAQGRRRADPIEDLLNLRFGARIDQQGVMVRDFQTARKPKAQPRYRADAESMPLSNRYYLCDAVFVVGLESDRALLEGLADNLLHPVFPLYLGRRSCVPSGNLVLGIVDDDLVSALRNHPWEAAGWYRDREERTQSGRPIRLELIRDALPGDSADLARERVRDNPRSFSPARRDYFIRDVIHDRDVEVAAKRRGDASQAALEHDPFTALEGEHSVSHTIPH